MLLYSLQIGFSLGRYPIPDLILYLHPFEGLTNLKYSLSLSHLVLKMRHTGNPHLDLTTGTAKLDKTDILLLFQDVFFPK
jgi:hypothetical protein